MRSGTGQGRISEEGNVVVRTANAPQAGPLNGLCDGGGFCGGCAAFRADVGGGPGQVVSTGLALVAEEADVFAAAAVAGEEEAGREDGGEEPEGPEGEGDVAVTGVPGVGSLICDADLFEEVGGRIDE